MQPGFTVNSASDPPSSIHFPRFVYELRLQAPVRSSRCPHTYAHTRHQLNGGATKRALRRLRDVQVPSRRPFTSDVMSVSRFHPTGVHLGITRILF